MILHRSRFSLPATAGALSATLWCAFGLALVATAQLRAQSPVFSEDFESGSLSKAVWETRTVGTASATVQQTQVAHGKSAVQIHYPKGERGSIGFIVASHLPDSVRSHLFGRAYVFVGPGAPAGHDVLINAGTAGYPLSNFLEIGASGGKNVMMSYQQNATTSPRGETLTRGAAYPVGRWFCLEWEFNDHPDTITVWIDGEPAGEFKDQMFKPRAPNAGKAGAAAKGGATAKEAATVAPAATATPAPEVAAVPCTDMIKGFTDFAFGFRAWGNGGQTDFDIYYDDIAIDTKRIGPVK